MHQKFLVWLKRGGGAIREAYQLPVCDGAMHKHSGLKYVTPDQRHAGRAAGILKWREKVTRLLFNAETHRIFGSGIVGTHAGDMIGEIALAIEMGQWEPNNNQ